MPGFNASSLQYAVQNANSVVVMIGDVPIAFAQRSGQNIDFGTDTYYGIGSAKPQEIQQLKFAPTVTVTAFVLTNQGITVLNYPSSIVSILANNSFDIHLMDQTGIPLLTFVGCVAGSFAQDVPVNSVISEDLNFMAMDVLDNTGTSILVGNFALTNITQITAAGVALNSLGL